MISRDTQTETEVIYFGNHKDTTKKKGSAISHSHSLNHFISQGTHVVIQDYIMHLM